MMSSKVSEKPTSSEKPNNCETCKWWEGNTNFCYSKADSDDHACHYEPKDKWREERSSE